MHKNRAVETNTPNNENPVHITLSDIILIALGSLAIISIGTFILFRSANINIFTSPSLETPSMFVNVSLTALEGAALIISIYIFGIKRRQMSWQDLGMKSTSSRWILVAGLVVIIFIPIIAAIAMLIQFLLGQPIENPQLEFLLPDEYSWIGAVSMLLLGGFVVPFAEELFFRGVLYQWLRNIAGVWIGIIISSLIFVFLHGDLSVAGATFVMGIVLAWFFERSKSLWPSITIHVLNNSIKIFLLYALIALGIPL